MIDKLDRVNNNKSAAPINDQMKFCYETNIR